MTEQKIPPHSEQFVYDHDMVPVPPGQPGNHWCSRCHLPDHEIAALSDRKCHIPPEKT